MFRYAGVLHSQTYYLQFCYWSMTDDMLTAITFFFTHMLLNKYNLTMRKNVALVAHLFAYCIFLLYPPPPTFFASQLLQPHGRADCLLIAHLGISEKSQKIQTLFICCFMNMRVLLIFTAAFICQNVCIFQHRVGISVASCCSKRVWFSFFCRT